MTFPKGRSEQTQLIGGSTFLDYHQLKANPPFHHKGVQELRFPASPIAGAQHRQARGPAGRPA